MNIETTSPALVAASPGSMHNTPEHCSKPVPKYKRVLGALFAGRSLNRFEAETAVRDHCLHSTISELEKKGVTIDRHEESIAGYMGVPTRVMRYRLSSESRERAAELLGVAVEPTQ